MRRVSSVAGSRRRWLRVPGEGARAGLRWIAVNGGELALREKGALRAQDRQHEGRAGALVALATCDALKEGPVTMALTRDGGVGARQRPCSRSDEEEAQEVGRGGDLRVPAPLRELASATTADGE